MSEPDGMRRANYQRMSYELAKQFRIWRRDAPSRREQLSPYSTETTPRMGDMTDEQIDYYAREISRRDAERSINMSNESAKRSKARAGEAA